MLASIQHRFASELSLSRGILQRAFAKVRNFKAQYPELYSHVHPDSRSLFDQPWVGSKQMVKWVCDKGPDHVWSSELGNRIRSYKKAHHCDYGQPC